MKDSQGLIWASAVIAGVVLYFIWKRKDKSMWKEVAYVDKLFVHPVKSCRGLLVDSFTASARGIMANKGIGDRSLMVVHEGGRFATIRQYPRMVLIKPTVIDHNKIRLEAPGMDQIEIQLPDHHKTQVLSYKVFGTFCPGADCGDEVAVWLQKFLKADTRLVFHSQELPCRKGTMLLEYSNLGVYAEATVKSMFQDFSPFNLVSQASIDLLNTKLDSSHQVTERNFRPNIVLKGCDAFAEDSWSRIKIGNAEMQFAKHCTRCRVTTVNPDTGVMDVEQNTLNTLKSFRLCESEEKPLYGDSPKFCVDFVVLHEGKISVGDKVYVYEG